jgi:hypothetical protein
MEFARSLLPTTNMCGQPIRHLRMGQKLPNIHCLVDKTMNMCKRYLTETYLKTSEASSCRCIGIAGCLRYNRGNFTLFLGNTLGLSLSQVKGGITTAPAISIHPLMYNNSSLYLSDSDLITCPCLFFCYLPFLLG